MAAKAKKTTSKHTKKLNLALQGGGAHGAYTWGVLDRLLEDDDIYIEGISGASAGAMNAAIFATGHTKGGRQGARDALAAFWQDVSQVSSMAALQFPPTLQDLMSGNYNLRHSLAYGAFDALTHAVSPYDLNPLNINPLRMILERHVDTESLAQAKIKLFIAATSVRSGRARVFHCHEVTPDTLLASACIPSLFQAVIIDDEPYWDGGYMGNPVIWPLIYNTDVSDVMLVQINPVFSPELPKTAYDINNRINEITFNSSLLAEMRAINFVSKLVRENKLDPDKYRDVRMHMLSADDVLKDLDASSKVNARWDFFLYLRDHGRAQMDAWLRTHKDRIGEESTINIQKTFLEDPIRKNRDEKRRVI